MGNRIWSLSTGFALAIGLILLPAANVSGLTVAKGQKPHPIEAKDADGNQLSLKQYAGKLVLLDFWATWCPPCWAEIPVIKEVYKKYHKQGFEVIGIALDEDPEDVAKFVKKHEAPWRQVLDTVSYKSKFSNKYGIVAIPTAILVAPDGKIIDTFARGSRLERLVEKHIKSVTNKDPIKIPKVAAKQASAR